MNLEAIYARIQSRLEAVGLSAAGASKRAGLSADGIRNIERAIRSGSHSGVSTTTLTALAPVLETTVAWLVDGDDAPAATPLPKAGDVRPAEVVFQSSATPPKDVPVLGTAAGSGLGNGAFQLTTDVIDYARRPAGLAGARDAYALYVEGESMAPRFEPGDIVFVHPHRKPQPGDYVIIQEADTNNGEPRAFIKRLVRMTGTTVRVMQFNPEATIDFVIRPGTVVHKVITDTELYGV